MQQRVLVATSHRLLQAESLFDEQGQFQINQRNLCLIVIFTAIYGRQLASKVVALKGCSNSPADVK